MTVPEARQAPSPPLPLPAVDEDWVALDGHRMRYLHAGRGRPLLLIHGLLGYSFSWRFNITELARHATVYAIDLLGLGFSDRPVIPCSLRDTATLVRRFLDQLGIEELDLLGTSYGGAVALMLASLEPARVSRMVLSAPANPWSLRGRWLAPLLSSPPLCYAVPAVYRTQLARRLQLNHMYADLSRIAPGTLAGYVAPFETPGVLDHVLRLLRTWNQDLRELRALIPAIADIPTLLIWGSKDQIVPQSSMAPLRACFRRAELIMLPDAGHLPYEEVPAAFNRAVIEFLTR